MKFVESSRLKELCGESNAKIAYKYELSRPL